MKSEDDEWKRHYDQLLWLILPIFVVAIGGLLLHLNSDKNFNSPYAVFGFILTILAVYFAASFRRLKHKHSKNDEKRPDLPQWEPFVFIFMILGYLWIKLLIDNNPKNYEIWLLMGFIGFILLIFLWNAGKYKKN